MMLYRQGKVPGSFYDGYGQEAVSAGATWAMAAEDRLCILHRDLAAHIIRGVDPARIFGQYMGRDGGITRGREGNVHFGDRTVGCVGMVSMLPDMMLVATGLAMAFKMRGEQRVAMTWFGDGSTSRGDFHEAMNWAGVQKLPVIFVLENNQYAYSTPVDQQFAVNPVERAAAYGFPGQSVDGNDPEAMFEATRKARERALAGEGPTLLEAVTMRMHGHAAHDDMKYVPKEQVEEWRAKDPIDRQTRRIEALGIDVQALRDEVKVVIDAAVEEALAMPMPDPDTATDRLFADEPALLEDGQAPVVRLQGAPDHGHDDVPAGDQRRHARGDARRRARVRDGRGHRRLRRRLQGDRRLHRRVRADARDGHAAGRVGDHRHRDRRRRRGHAPDRRDAVLGLHLVRLRPARQRRRQDVLPPGPVGEHHRPPAVRRRLLRRPVPLPEPRGVVHAQPRPEGGRAVDGRGRQGPADLRRARPQPGRVHGAQAPVPAREGRGRPAARTRRRSPRASRARGPTSW